PLIAALSWSDAARSEPTDNAPFKVGVTARRVAPPEPYEWRGAGTRALIPNVWSPADARTQVAQQFIGPPNAPPLFEAPPAGANAELARSPAKLPLIMLSHGTGGTGQSR